MASVINKLSKPAGIIAQGLNINIQRSFGITTINSSHAFRSMHHMLGPRALLTPISSKALFHSTPAYKAESDFKCAVVFKTMAETLAKQGESIVKKVNGVYGFSVKNGPNGEEGNWIVDAKNGSGSVEFNGTAKPDVTLTMNDADLLDMMTGKLEPQKAFFKGQLKIKGNMGLAMKLKEFQQVQAKKQ